MWWIFNMKYVLTGAQLCSAVVQELGREGVLPCSKFFASNWPFHSPAAGLLEHYVVSAVILLAPPPGDAYNFLLK